VSSPIRSTHLSHLQDVCDNATVALFVMDDQQCCVYMNPAAESLTGYRLDEVMGSALHNFIHHTRPDGTYYPLEECPVDRAAPTNMQERGEEIFVHRDGSFYPVHFTASPVRRDGEVVGTVIEVQDARPRQQQEREREALHAIGLLILQELSHEKIVDAVTEASTQLTGAQFGAFFYNVRDEDGESYTLYTIAGVPKEHFSQFPLPRATHLFGPTFRGEGVIRSADIRTDPRYGKMAPHHGMPPGHLPVRSYLAVPVSLGDGQVVGGLFFGHEEPGRFTESHERLVETLAAQAAIGLNKASLYQEALFARRRAEHDAVEKQKLYEEAASANEAKDQFLATVSHELRTPLTSILGWAQMLTAGKLDEPTRMRAIATIERNARSQAQIVEDLLDISRIVNGKLRLNVQLFSPQTSLESALEALRPAAAAKNIRLQLVMDPMAGPVSGDPERLQQIAWNLLSNAIKFTQKGGRVQLTLRKLDSNVQIIVSDNGAGIPAEHLPTIFETFTQVDPTSTRKHGGLGLGLAIVRKLVELHGGTVAASSDGPGKGAVLTVALPLAALKEDTPTIENSAGVVTGRFSIPTSTGDFRLEGATILLVEDDDDARGMIAAVLLSARAVVESASNAYEALIKYEGIQPDLIVSDIGMPDMDGYEFIAELRRRERDGGRPIAPAVALTAYARVQDRMRALTAGFQMHIAKPVEPAELLTVLSSLRSWKLPPQ
jgi:PAS domain S-box-containing protein